MMKITLVILGALVMSASAFRRAPMVGRQALSNQALRSPMRRSDLSMAQQTMLETNVGSLKDMVPSKQKAKPTDPVSTVLSNYATASPGDSVATAVLAMNTAKRASILVMNEDRSMAGIFTERDFVTRVLVNNKDPNDIKLSDVMTPAKDLLIASTRSSIGDCRQKMLSNNIRHLPIVDDENKVTGVVSMSEIIKVLQYETLRLESANLATDGSVDATMRQREIANQIALSTGEEGSKQDLARTGYVVAAGAVGVALLQAGWVHDNEYISMTAVFLLGYAGIIFEDIFEFNKAAVALLMSTALWTIYASEPGSAGVLVDGAGSMLGEKLAEVSEIAFFLMGAMTIVEVVDAHQGFKVVTDKINSKDLRGLMWVIGLLTFFMSAILDNLTTTIVMVSLLKKILPEGEDRKLFGALIVIAANAGGAWTPIGDVTTTMLWINGQISALPTMTSLVIPSLISTLIPIAVLSQQLPEGKEVPENTSADVDLAPRGNLVFAAGIGGLLAVPAFKALTGLPPYLGMLASLGTLWGITDAIHAGEDRDEFMAPAALKKIDTSGVLFFTGILMSVAALDSAGILKSLAETMDKAISSEYVLATVIGIASALIDNVPLVAATMGMYDINTVTPDSQLWQLIAYCAGTGGSLLVIGSAAGVALMGQEKVDFFWYAKKVTVAAFAGYIAGVGAYAVQNGAVGGIMNGVAQMPLVHDALTALPVF